MRNSLLISFLLLEVFFLSGCYQKHVPISSPVENHLTERDTVYNELVREKVISVLQKVRIVSQKSEDLDSLGFATMEEAMEIMNIGSASVSTILESLRAEKDDWKMRFWLIDILGYLDDERSIESLANILLNSREKKENRICTIGALGRIRHENAHKELRNALNVLEEQPLREKVAEALIEWKRYNKHR